MNPAMAPSKADRTRQAIIDLLAREPLTADVLADRLDLSILYVRPRVSELFARARIMPSGEYGINASGRPACKWTVA